jgi:Ca2+-transporting ATPase
MLNNQNNKFHGLTSAEAEALFRQHGPNEIPSAKKRSPFAVIAEIVREPMFILLIACGTLYLLLGDIEEAIMLLGFVFVVIGITFFQERKTDRALDALRDLSSPRALTIRDGVQTRIAGRDVVPGDVILLSEGDRVPADTVLIECTNLSVDESLLTGESVAVQKTSTAIEVDWSPPGGENLPFVYSGTLVVRGQGIGVVKTTGVQTQIGKIGKALQVLQPENTPLQKKTGKLVRNFAIVGAALCLTVVIMYGLLRGSWLEGMLAGLTLGMAILPEEFPVVLTIFLALGAWRISQKRVLTRRVPAVETLGSATVICTDKTGTLTLNQMTITDIVRGESRLRIDGTIQQLPEEFLTLVEYSILSSQDNAFDPMEKAMVSLGERLLPKEHIRTHDLILLKEYPLSRELLSMSRVWKSKNDGALIVAAKGAPEAIADLCHFSEAKTKEITDAVNSLADQGKRVIAVARGNAVDSNLPPGQHDFDYEFIGLLGLEDPVRPGVREAIQECYSAGVRVIMITGDYPGTAKNIAAQIGLKNPDQCITGAELEKMPKEVLQGLLSESNIFARMVPEQKLRLVNVLKSMGEVVAMTGDGVNDAPALKSAHIGIAMGGRGTDVARESSSIVLLDDDFSSIVAAIKTGRRIYDNLKKAMMYIFSVHIPIAGMSLLPILFGWPLALFPIHVVFLELIIDPACTIVFEGESEEKNIMQRPPRKLNESLFGLRGVIIGLIQGVSVLIAIAFLYYYTLTQSNEYVARTVGFVAMVLANLGLILSNRSQTRSIIATLRTPNKAVWWIVMGTLIFLCASVFVPALARLFRFEVVQLTTLLLASAAALVGIMVSELIKLRPFRKNGHIE